MAGKGSRFVKAGYSKPKPFIDTGNGIPMIQRVVENLMPYEPHRFIFLARRDHEDYIRQYMSFATDVIYVDEVTEGAACTVLLAKQLINNSDGLIIANSDQLVVWNDGNKVVTDVCNPGFYWKESNNIQDMINYSIANGDACIATFNSNHTKWSYAKIRDDGFVGEVAEKQVISDNATVGIYYFDEGRFFVRAAEQMISNNIRVNNEFYVCPSFNEMVEHFGVNIYPVRTMIGLGTPEDLEKYLNDI